MIGIYKITSPSNKIYIGQAIDIYDRWNFYKTLNCKGQTRLYNSLKFHGFENHKFEIMSLCYEEQLNEFERDFQDAYDVIGPNGLNCRLVTSKDKSGKISNETKEKMRIKAIGRLHTKETKLKISKIQIGRKFPKSHCEAISKGNKGKIISEDHKKILSEIRKGNKSSWFGKKGKDCPFAKKVICIETNQIWDSITECALENNIRCANLARYLNGTRTNKTTFKFLING